MTAENIGEVRPFPKARAWSGSGTITCPPDKSVTHRSVMLAALAKGESQVVHPLLGADCLSTLAAVQTLGVEVEQRTGAGGTKEIRLSSPGWDGWHSPVLPLDFGNSGTTTRLLTGVFAATPKLFVTCFGDASLTKRPMGRVVRPLRSIGAQIWGRDDGQLLPLAIMGQALRPAEHRIDKATAQVKSALLLAGMNIEGTTSVRLPGGSRDHTERMLRALGAEIRVEHAGNEEQVTLRGPFRPGPRRHCVPGDPSSAAFFAVLGALGSGEISVQGVLDNPTRTAFLTVLRQMGATVEVRPRPTNPDFLEPVVDLCIKGGKTLRGVETPPSLAPKMIDEIPILAVAALFATGRTVFRGLEELRVKESDRFAKVLELLAAAGGKAYGDGDDLVIDGLGDGGRVGSFRFDPSEDHRLAMAAAILAKFAEKPCQVIGPQCVAVSFPGFFDLLSGIA